MLIEGEVIRSYANMGKPRKSTLLLSLIGTDTDADAASVLVHARRPAYSSPHTAHTPGVAA